MIRAPNRCLLIGSILELDHRQRQAVEEEDDIGTALMLLVGNGELIKGEPVVVGLLLEIDDACLRAGDGAVRAAILDGDAIDQEPMDGTIALDE